MHPFTHGLSANQKCSQVRRIDGQLDRLQLSAQGSAPSSPVLRSTSVDNLDFVTSSDHSSFDLTRITELQTIVKALSTTSSSRPLLRASRLHELLQQVNLSRTSVTSDESREDPAQAVYERDLEWLLVSKATTQAYGLILNLLLEQTLPLSNDIWYWDEVLGSYFYSALYSVQTSPLRLWAWSKDIYQDARARLDNIAFASDQKQEVISQSLSDKWRQFYDLVRESIRDRSMADLQSGFLSPITICRSEARQKQTQLKKLREMSASGLGVLMDEGLAFDTDEEGAIISKGTGELKEEWKTIVSKSVALMETVLRNVTTLEAGISEFEDSVFLSVEEDPELVRRRSDEEASSRRAILVGRLQQILEVHIPNNVALSQKLTREHGRPSRLIRYWLPTTLLFVSSSTLLRIFFNRKAEILAWIRDLGVTVIDFWYNWVMEPVKRVIGTIRHDKDSEVAIMSKGSLEGDRASLERMVVDFAVDNPNNSTGKPISDLEIAAIRAKVKEGDLTPVLKAYERDLRKPIMGTVKGDLIRALLIQIQKTKVDVEVAVGGIDALLKSQELVFGYV